MALIAIKALETMLGGLDDVPVLVLGMTYRENVKELAYSMMNESQMRRYGDVVTSVFRVEPGQRCWGVQEVLSGVARPHRFTNPWRSDPARPLPQWLQLAWDKPQTISACRIISGFRSGSQIIAPVADCSKSRPEAPFERRLVKKYALVRISRICAPGPTGCQQNNTSFDAPASVCGSDQGLFIDRISCVNCNGKELLTFPGLNPVLVNN